MKKTLVLLLAVMMVLSGLVGVFAEGDPIRIGYFGPLTGGTAQAGQAALNGCQIAVDEINANGGVLGRQLEMVAYDDKSSPEEALKSATKLVQVDKVEQ